MGCIRGVSTSRQPRASRKVRVPQMRKAGFPVVPEGDHPPRDRHGADLLQRVLTRGVVAAYEVATPMGECEALAEGVDATRAQGLEFLEAPADEIVRLGAWPRRIRGGHARTT